MFEKFAIYNKYLIREEQNGQIAVIREYGKGDPFAETEVRKILVEIAKDSGCYYQPVWTAKRLGASLIKYIRKNKLVKKAESGDSAAAAGEKEWLDWWNSLHISTKWFLLDSMDVFKNDDKEIRKSEPFGVNNADMEYLKEQIKGLEIVKMQSCIHDISETACKNIPHLPYPDDLEKLAKLPNLKWLTFQSINFDEYDDNGRVLLKEITKLTQLDTLDFFDCKGLNPSLILELASMCNLERIQFYHPYMDDKNLQEEWKISIDKLREKLPSCLVPY